MKPYFIIVCLVFTMPSVFGQEPGEKIDPGLFINSWDAKWITYPETQGTEYGVYHARKVFDLSRKPASFILHISADNRYQLYVNEQFVCIGPARGDIWHWRYETIDIGAFLQPGSNVIALLFYNFGGYRPLAQHSHKTAFIIQGNSDMEQVINTGLDRGWKVCANKGYAPILIDWRTVNGFFAAGPCDSLNANLYPWNWKKLRFDDSDWMDAGNIGYNGSGIPHGYSRFSGNSAWKLVPRNIPMMRHRMERMKEIERSDVSFPENLIKGKDSVLIPSKSKSRILIDQTYLTKGYPQLKYGKGKDALIRIKYAEALIDAKGEKGNRNETDKKQLVGYYDIILADGGEERDFSPLWIRTFRYIEIEVQTRDEPLLLYDFYNLFTAYPFDKVAWIKSGEASLEKIFDLGWRTLEMCADETYWDCPYYEQLQYAGDTRTQALISQYISGDDRLFKNAIEQFDHSRLSNGVTYSRYPSYIPQVTPAYSLIWIHMVNDYLMLGKDPAFTGQFLDGIRSVIRFYQKNMDSTGMVRNIPYTNHIESKSGFPWAKNPDYMAQHNLLFAYSLLIAAGIFEFNHLPEEAKEFRLLADQINAAVRNNCYDNDRKLFADTPEMEIYSQHANTLAILSGASGESESRELMDRILNDTTLLPAFLFFKFYVFMALKKAGMGDLYLDQLDHWKNLMKYGFTTWPEFDIESRSDCHAWSAHPTYGLLANVCGIESVEPGFKKVRIAPSLGYLDKIEAEMPHPQGKIYLKLEKTNNMGIKGTIRLPENLSGVFEWDQRTLLLVGGEQSFELGGN